MENVKKLTTRTEVRLLSKKSAKIVVNVGKSQFVKDKDENGNYVFHLKDIEDPTNPRRNYKIADESKFITSIMNRTYYQQQEKGVKTPMVVTEVIPIPESELFPKEVAEVIVEKKVAQKSPKQKSTSKKKVAKS